MTTSIRDNTKRSRGRPVTTGKGELIGVRMLSPLLTKVDAWIAGEGDRPSRPEAVRRLVEKGLTVKRRSRKALRPDQLNAENDG